MKNILLATALGAGLFALGATQASAATLVVNDAPDVGGPSQCTAAAVYTTIQAAIADAAAGADILVCPGTYVEDLEIAKDGLTIAAVDRADKANTVIQGTFVSTGPFPNCGVAAGVAGLKLANINISADGVTVTGFTIQSPAVTTAGQYTCGLIVDGENNTIYQNAFKVSCGDPGSPAIQTWALGNGPKGSVGGLSIVANSFSSSKFDTLDTCFGYEAIYINPQTTTPSAQPVTIVHNTFSGKMYRAVAVDRDWTDVKYNNLETRFKLAQTDPLFNAFPIGIRVFGASNSVILGNKIASERNNRRFATGIALRSNTSNNVVQKNVVKGSRFFDCLDQSVGNGTADTANLWERNVGKKDSPNGICGGDRDHDDDDDRDD